MAEKPHSSESTENAPKEVWSRQFYIHMKSLDPDGVSFGTKEDRRSFPFLGQFTLDVF